MTQVLRDEPKYRPPGMSAKEAEEQARRAAQAFNRMIPTLTAFARMLTRNPRVQVVSDGSNPRTDGLKIYMRPLFGMGEVHKHIRKLCDMRDPNTYVQLCPACRQHETIMAATYHEIGHIAFGSFEKVAPHSIELAIKKAAEEHTGPFSQYAIDRIKNAPSRVRDDYMGLAGLVSPWLPVLVNAFEDVRVNHASGQTRPGVRLMLMALNLHCLSEVIIENDGTETSWKTKPLNFQAIMVAFCIAARYNNTEEYFAPEVQHLFSDPELKRLLADAETLRSAHATFYLAFHVLDRLRELGFCLREEEPLPPQQQSGGGEGGEDGEQSSESEMDPSGVGGEPSDDNTSEREGKGAEPGEVPESSPTGGSSTSSSQDEEAESDNQDVGGDQDVPEDDQSGESSSSPTDADEASSQEVGGEGDNETEDLAGDSAEGDGSSVSEDDDDAKDSDADGDESGSSGEGLSDDSGEPESSDPSGEASEDDAQAVDTGEDQGIGGIPADYDDRYGTAEAAQAELNDFFGHTETDEFMDEEMVEKGATLTEVEQLLDVAVIKGLYFETPPRNVSGIRVHTINKHATFADGTDAAHAFTGRQWRNWYTPEESGQKCDMDIPESVLGPALLKLRKVLADNDRRGYQRNLKAGRIRTAVLGKRAFNPDDERLFQKRRKPAGKEYAALIGIDVSGSTVGRNIALAKRAAKAQATLLARAGIKFSVWAHSAKYESERGQVFSRGDHVMDMYCIKDWDDPWDTRHIEVLDNLAPDNENLDGHTFEFYRKRLDEIKATDKILMYYTDGKMPAANAEEELAILQRELETCRKRGYIVPGVGIRTDSPTKHGLDTVRVDDDEDLIKVVDHLQKLIRS